MGCCWSSNLNEDNGDPNSERAPLLGSQQPDGIPTLDANAQINIERLEYENLRKIVQKTAESLVDISTVRMMDKLQPDHIEQRASEYQSIIKEIGLKTSSSKQDQSIIITNLLLSSSNKISFRSTKNCSSNNHHGASNTIEIVNLDEEKSKKMAEYLNRIRKSLKEIKRIEPVGEVIVKLQS